MHKRLSALLTLWPQQASVFHYSSLSLFNKVPLLEQHFKNATF